MSFCSQEHAPFTTTNICKLVRDYSKTFTSLATTNMFVSSLLNELEKKESCCVAQIEL